MFTIYADGQLIYQPNDQELLVLQPKLTLEMGASGSLDFRIPPTHPFYNQLKQLTTVITASLDGVEIFRGRVLSNSRDFYNYRQTYCEGCLSYLVDSVQKGEKYVGTAHALFRQIIAKHNSLVNAEKQFTVGNITVDDKDLKIAGKSTGDEEDPDSYSADYWRQIYIDSVVDNWSTTWDYINRTLIDYQGGYLMVRRVGNTNYLDWVKEFSSTAAQPIEFGSNLLDLTEEISADQLFTVLIPIGDDNLTIASVNGGSIELADAEKVAQYGRIVRTEVFSNVNSAATLLENGRNFLQNEANVPVTFTIKAIDLSMINRDISAIRLGDRVKISSTPHSIDKYYTCTKIEYDLENPSNTVFTFGNPRQTLTQRYRRDKRIEKESAERNSVSGSSVQQEAAEDVMHFHVAGETAKLKDEITNSTTGDTKKKLDEFWDAWIHTNASQGNINLGAVYKRLEDAVLVLQQNAGLDIDAPSGTVNIFTTATTASSAQSTANSADSKAGDAQTKTAQIILWAGVDENGNLGSNIALNADLVSVSNRLTALEGVFDSITANKIHANRLIDSAGGFYGPSFIVSDTTGGPNEVDLAGHKHSLYCDSNGNVTMGLPVPPNVATGFNIAETQFFKDAVSAAGAASVKTIVANRETTDGNIVWDAENMTIGADFTLVAKDKDGNTLYSEYEYPIILPATKAFNAGKASAAITASDITIAKAASPDPYGTDQDENKYINVTATITNPDGTTTTKTTSILVADIYGAGEQSVTVSSLVQYSFMDIGPKLTVTSPNTDWTGSYLRVSPQVVLSNGKSQVVRLYIDATKARATVTVDGISSLSAASTTSKQHTINSAGTSYNATTGKLEVKVRTRLTNSAKYDSTLLIDPSTAQAAVNIGTVAQSAYNASADHSVAILDENVRFIGNMLYGTINVPLSNGTTETVYIGVDATKAMSGASEDVMPVASIIASRETTDGNIVWNATNKTLSADYTLTAKDINGNVLYNELEYPIVLPATKAYNAGQDYGAGTVAVTGASTSISNTHLEEDGHHYVVASINPTARATKSDGTYATAYGAFTGRKITADAVYTAGYNAGVAASESAPVSSISANRETTDANIVWNSSSKTLSADFTLVAKDSSNNILYRELEYPISLPATKAYTAGVDSVTIPNSGITSTKYGSYYHNDVDGYYVIVDIEAVASNGNTGTKTAIVRVNDVFEAGRDSAPSSGSNLDHINLSCTYQESNHAYSIVASAYDKNGNILMSRSTSSGSDAWNAGWDEGYAANVSTIGVAAVGYEQDENGSTDWNHIWVRLSTGAMHGNIQITPNGYTTGWNAGYRQGSSSASGSYNEGYNAGYDAGYSVGYNTGRNQGIIDINRITSLTITTPSSGAGIRAYHSDGSYSWHFVKPGDYWNGYD